jgi:hypothetical protein
MHLFAITIQVLLHKEAWDPPRESLGQERIVLPISYSAAYILLRFQTLRTISTLAISTLAISTLAISTLAISTLAISTLARCPVPQPSKRVVSIAAAS